MDVSIGMPNAIAGTKGDELVEFARLADQAGFASLGTIDRIVFDNYEPLTALAAAAAVTERIRLLTSVLLVPLRRNAMFLAKQAATVQALSGGRLTLGLGLGAREDDYEATGVSTKTRGQAIDEFLETAQRVWSGEEFGFAGGVGPGVREDPPRVIIGGTAEASFDRAARHDGWILGGGGPEVFAAMRENVLAAWERAGRDDEPRLMSLAYFSLSDDAQADAEQGFGGYYAWLGDEMKQMIVDGSAKDADKVREYRDSFAEAGCDELVFFPSSADPQNVERLAEAAL